MTVTAHVYQIHIAADVDQVWTAITSSDWTRRYLHSTSFVEPPRAGARYRTVTADGRDAVDGVVEEMTPPGPGRPGRFVQTWHVLYDAALAEEPPGRVEWTVEKVGDGLTRVRLVHGDLAASPGTWASVKDGWVWILDGLKTVLETDRELPPVAVELTEEPEPDEGAWHRIQGIAATNEALELLAQERGDVADERLLRLAYAAAYHWERAAGRTTANEARAAYLVSRALTATGQPERGLVSADRCLTLCAEHGLTDFDLAYSYEARARALHSLGRFREAVEAWDRAQRVEIADPEDRAVVESDFARLSPVLG
jgi:uncharacterized protein YndB with AHSA1/START domain